VFKIFLNTVGILLKKMTVAWLSWYVSLGKTLNAVSHFGAKQSTRCGGPAWWKTCKQSSFCVGVVWQTQSIVQHLAQTKKKTEENVVFALFSCSAAVSNETKQKNC